MTNPYYNRITDFVPDTAVRSSDMDAELNGVVAGFDLLSDPTKIGNGAGMNGGESGVADGYIWTNGDGTTVPLTGQIITFSPTETNTGASTVSYNGGANTTIVRNDGTALQAGDLVAGVPVAMIYDSVNDRWVLVGSTAQQTLAQFRPGVNSQSGTTYTVVGSDEAKIVLCDNAAAVSVSIPNETTEALSVGFIVHIHQAGLGKVTLIPEAGVSLHASVSLSTRVQYSSLSLIKTAVNVFKVIGDMDLG